VNKVLCLLHYYCYYCKALLDSLIENRNTISYPMLFRMLLQWKFRFWRVTASVIVSVNFFWFNFSSRSFWHMPGIYMGTVRYGTLTITRQERNFHCIFKNKIKLNKDNKENFYSYWTLYVVVYINQNYKIVQQHFFG